jgi:hypothetical protein
VALWLLWLLLLFWRLSRAAALRLWLRLLLWL